MSVGAFMAKKGSIHENYGPLKVILTNGSVLMMKSACKGDVLQLSVDKLTHTAWTGRAGTINKNVSEVTKFQERFGNLGNFCSK